MDDIVDDIFTRQKLPHTPHAICQTFVLRPKSSAILENCADRRSFEVSEFRCVNCYRFRQSFLFEVVDEADTISCGKYNLKENKIDSPSL